MSVATGCFENVFGLSRSGCECLGTPPDDYDVSMSGLYLDETPAFNIEKVFGAANCNATGWEIMTKAREHGIKSFTDRVLREVRSQTKWKRSPIKATIGSTDSGTGTVNLAKTYHGMDVLFPDHRGGTATLKRIGMYVKFTGTVTVSVYEEDNDTPITTFSVNTTANRLTWTDVVWLDLDMDADGASNKRYWFLWEPTGGQQALNSRIHCGCSGTPTWSCAHPWWSNEPNKPQAWYKWAMANGTYGDTLIDRENWTHNNATQGMLLEFDFRCDARTSICYAEPDYQGDPLQSAFAWGARYEAALYIINYISGSTRVNRETLTGGDELERLRVSYMAEVQKFAEYMGGYLSGAGEDGYLHPEQISTYSDCFICNNNGPSVKSIRA